MNLGSLWIVFVSLVLQFAILFAIRGCKKRNRFCKYWNDKLYSDLIWTGPIDYFITGFIDIGFALAMNLNRMTSKGGWGIAYVTNYSLVVFIFCMLVFTIWHISFLCKNFDHLEDEEFEIYEAAFSGMAKKNRSEIWIYIIFYSRRIAFVLIMTQDVNLFTQLVVLTIIPLVNISYVIVYKPFEE